MPKLTKYPRLRVYVKRGKAGQVWTSYAYDMRGTGKPDVALGSDYAQAVKQWDDLHNKRPRIVGTIEEAFQAWEKAELPTKATETRKGYTRSLHMMRDVFGPATWDGVTFPILKAYLRKRTGKTQANRELALLQVIWNWARGEGYTALQWPASGMERAKWKNKETARQLEVTDAMFDAVYKHADPLLRDALDIATATGLRVRDVLRLQMPAQGSTKLLVQAGKTGKRAEFDLSASAVLPAIVERRRAHKAPHLMMLTCGDRIVTERMLSDRFKAARAAAADEVPECSGMYLRDCRKRASQLAGSLSEASALLQHSSQAVTARHYRGGEKLRPVR